MFSKFSFSVYYIAARRCGATPVEAPDNDYATNVDALLAAVTRKTRVVFLANPNNPTGTFMPREELERLHAGLPSDVLLVVDQAYAESLAPGEDDGGLHLAAAHDNVLVTRTFSKAYGLAGMRVGWGLFPPEIAREVRKVMNPNNITIAGQTAAKAALMDQSYMRDTCRKTTRLRDRLRRRLQQAGLDVPESFTNFILIRMGSPDAAHHANEALRAEGVFLRPQGGVGLADSLRMTIGPADDIDIAAGLLERWAEGKKT